MPDFFIPKTEKELTENVHIVNFALELPSQISQLVSDIQDIGGRSYLVGGSVRDSILSAKTGIDFQMKDFDFEVYGLDPVFLKQKLSEKYGKVEEVGESFGVFKIKLDGIDEAIDIAIPRIDKVSEDSKKGRGIIANSDPYLDMVQAVKRRDITINSILYDPLSSQIIDPFGGWYDLMEGTIRVTDSETFIEDPLRVLRVAQFASRFGFKISKETVDLSKKLCKEGGLNSLVIERVRDEIDKLLLKGYEPSVGLRFLKEIGYLDILIPELSILSNIPQEPDYHPEGDVFTHTMQVVDAMSDIVRRESKKSPMKTELKRALILGALFHDLGKEPMTVTEENGRIRSHGHEEAGVPITREILKRIYKTKEQGGLMPYEKLILFLVSDHMKPLLLHKEHEKGTDMDKALRRFVNRCFENETTMEQILMIVEADKLGRNSVNVYKPLSLEEKPELLEALKWFKDVTESLRLEISDNSKNLLNVKKFLKLDICSGLRPGPWISIINRCIQLDTVDGLIKNEDEAQEKAVFYFTKIFKDNSPKDLVDKSEYWLKFKVEDPRELLELD
jgi:tRNA nucleotidyltransferase (CCA-adding enzyme)